MDFEKELEEVLPAELPNREVVIVKGAGHLRLIVEANASMNLTRITSPREAAIKHVLDSVLPWRLFVESREVLDAGTGPGFPGLSLALTLPDTNFTLAESTGKKARFVEACVATLGIGNVAVSNKRAEDVCRTGFVKTITARALAPISRSAGWFAPALRKGASAFLYKGPDASQEITEAAPELNKLRLRADVILRYELPDLMGARTIVKMTAG